jgi:hypothetical protein
MQSVNKYNRKNRIGLGRTTGGAVLTILAAAIGLLLVLNNNRLGTMAPPAPVSKVQPAAQDRTLAEIMGSGQYPFGAAGFDSLLPSQPARTRPAGVMSGQYPFGATGFDSLLAGER